MAGATDILELTWDTDGDGTGRLGCSVAVEGWSGHSEGWFNRGEVLEFASSLRTFPLPPEGLPPLESGFSRPPYRQGIIEVVTVSLRAVAVGGRGQVGIDVMLRPWDPFGLPALEPRSLLHVRLPCTYPGLERFAGDMENMVGPERLGPTVGNFSGRAVVHAERFMWV